MKRFGKEDEYESFIYHLIEQYDSIKTSTLVFIRVGSTVAKVRGELTFSHGFRLVVSERFYYQRYPSWLDWYGYIVYQGQNKLYWYDPQPHPHIEALQENHPHHKHIPPNIKRNRVTAPDLSFMKPNLPFLIAEIEELITQIESE